MPAYADLVHQTTTTTGTGALTLAAVNGKRAFVDGFGTGGTNTFDYYISHRTAAEWERGTGHESGGTLVRDTVLASSNANALVAFSAGTMDVTNDQPAGKRVDVAALDLKAPLASPAFTGTPTGITKAHVGLSDVDNTSDASKPVSTATQTALDLKLAKTGDTLSGRVNPRISSAAAGDITADISAFDQYVRTGLTAAIAINAPTGTPLNGNKLIFRLKDNGTARALAWNAIFRAVGVIIPTTTVINKTTYVGAVYNSDDTLWDVVAAVTQA